MSEAMRADRATILGQRGELEVAAQLAALGWGPVRTELGSDLGTDIFAQIRDDRLFEVGLLLSIQVKTGASYFRKSATVQGLGTGWWHEQRDYDHFESWVQHTIPHILVLRNVDTGLSYWAHVNRDAVVSMDRGTKIFVPASQLLNERFREKLIGLAATQRERDSLEGTVWRGERGRRFSPANAFRTALLCPRLVAPHPNESPREIGPEEVIALCLSGREQDVPRHLTRRARRPRDVNEMAKQREFRWRFASEVFQATARPSLDFSSDLQQQASNSHSRVASGMLHVCSLLRADRVADALEFLTSMARNPVGVDRAWVLVQKARCFLLQDEFATALEVAEQAKQATLLYLDDQTATAIAGAAEAIAFAARRQFTAGTLKEVVQSGDTAVSWWRSQVTAAGLTKWTESNFKRQFQDAAVTIAAVDTAYSRLRAAMWSADLLADESAWRPAASLYAKYLLSSRPSTESQTAGLDLLRQVGDKKSLKLAAEFLWRFGPGESLPTVAGRFERWRWSGDVLTANLVLLSQSADLLDDATRSGVVGFLCEALLDGKATAVALNDDSERSDVVKVISAVGAVSRDAGTQNRIANLLLALLSTEPEDGGLLENQLGNLAASMQIDVVQEELIDALVVESAALTSPRLSADLLSALLRHPSAGEAAKRALFARAAAGELHALRRTPRKEFRSALESADVTSLVASQVEELTEIRRSAAEESHFDGGSGAPATLALLSADYPHDAKWGELVAFLADRNLPKENKRELCRTLATVVSSIPPSVRNALSEAAADLDHHPIEFGFFGTLAGGHVQLLAALGMESEAQTARRLTALIGGTMLERVDAAAAASYWDSPIAEGILVALSKDSTVQVRATALSAMFQRPESSADLPALALKEIMADPGVSVPMQILQSWNTGEVESVDLPLASLEVLARHQSASVRMNAEALLRRSGVASQAPVEVQTP